MPNNLATATSPYLLQHRDNPVDWHQWGEAAFEEARSRDVPVLLSVGYAACHWCHVMAHESFEDPDTAALMNRLFVNVKVDREERPDVDSIYMEAVQAMTGRGGWPMTVWLDHQGRPFFAGTYFPNVPRHGMASFQEVMTAVSSAWNVRRSDVEEQARTLVEAIAHPLPDARLLDEEGLKGAYRQVSAAFDPAHGGFGHAPKFPQQPVLEFILRVSTEEWASEAADMVISTLEVMARGGIHDQIGGGFARYAVDNRWLVPHFEKMLYDNAQLARIYLWAGVEFGRDDFIAVARSTLDYLIRDLRHPEGGFFSSEDADSEGVEGKFYVWTPDEIRSVLDDDAPSLLEYYGVTDAGNFEGANILSVVGEEAPPALESAKARLLETRATRIRPGLDDKVIASWNGLTIRALAEAGAVLHDERYLRAAREAAVFVLERLTVDDKLMRSWREGQVSVAGFLDDHASVALGLFALYAATGEAGVFEDAMRLVHHLGAYANPDGGFYATASEGEKLVKRPLDHTDNPLPSGNAMAAEAMLLAGLYNGEQDFRVGAERALASVGMLMHRYPSMVGHHLSVLHATRKARELAIAGPEWRQLAEVHWRRFRPHIALAGSAAPKEAIPLLQDRHSPGRTLAYVCRGFVCDLPTSDPDELARQLG